MRFSTFPWYNNWYNYQLVSPAQSATCMPLHPLQCATLSLCRKLQPPEMTLPLKIWLCMTLSQYKRQVTHQSFKGVFMVLAASDSEHLIIFINIHFSAFLQGKKMPLPQFFQVRKRGWFTASFRYNRHLLTLHQSSSIPASTQVLHLGRSSQVPWVNVILSQGWNQLCKNSKELVFNQRKVLEAGSWFILGAHWFPKQPAWSCLQGCTL